MSREGYRNPGGLLKAASRRFGRNPSRPRRLSPALDMAPRCVVPGNGRPPACGAPGPWEIRRTREDPTASGAQGYCDDRLASKNVQRINPIYPRWRQMRRRPRPIANAAYVLGIIRQIVGATLPIRLVRHPYFQAIHPISLRAHPGPKRRQHLRGHLGRDACPPSYAVHVGLRSGRAAFVAGEVGQMRIKEIFDGQAEIPAAARSTAGGEGG